MSTYRATFSLLSNNGFTEVGSYPTGEYEIDGGALGAGATITGSLAFSLSGNCVYLDGSSVAIPLAGVPFGFVPTDADLRQIGTSNGKIGDLQKLASDEVV